MGEELVSKRFRPDPVRRVKIPKRDGGGERALGIPTIRERVVQAAAKIVLEPIFEADFEGTAYDYRPKRGAVDAVKEVHRHLCQCYTDVVNAEGGQRAGSCLVGGRYNPAGNCWQKLAFNFTEPDCPECSPP